MTEENRNYTPDENIPDDPTPSESTDVNEHPESVDNTAENVPETSISPEINTEHTVNSLPDPIEKPKSPYIYHWEASDDKSDGIAKKKSNRGPLTFAIVMSVSFAIALFALFAVLLIIPKTSEHDSSSYSIAEIAEICSPYTVSIESTKYTSTGVSIGYGTGFILTENGYIITNYHVVENAKTIIVYTYDGKEYSGRNIGYDADLDIAVIRVHPEEGVKLTVAPVANSSEVKTGESVVAIGTPTGLDFGWTVTAGYVSCADRVITVTGTNTKQHFIQFDAAVNPGNSGGPLINNRGEVIGIVRMRINDTNTGIVYDKEGNVIGYTDVSSGADGMGLAIPINEAIDLYEKFRDADMSEPMLGVVGVSAEKDVEYFSYGNSLYRIYESTEGSAYKYVYIDMVPTELTDALLVKGTLITPEATGFVVFSISSSSGAVGILQPGDIITEFSGVKLEFADTNGDGVDDVDPFSTVIGILSTKNAGDIVEVTFCRNGNTYTESIKLTPKT